MSLTGFVGFSGPALVYRLQGNAKGVRVRYPEGASTTVNATVNLNGTSQQSLLAGTVTIVRAAFTPRSDLASLLAAVTKSGAAPVPQDNDYIRGMQLDVRIESEPNLEFQTSLTRGLQAEVDLRPRFFQLELGVKNQGHRPSCAVFAIVSALEFQNAELTGKVEKFSEEYLIWAVRKSVRRLPSAAAAAPADPGGEEYQDEGFALAEVVAALRAYGIPLQASMPNTFGSRIESIEDPPPAIVQEARSHQRVFVHQVPGRICGRPRSGIPRRIFPPCR